MGCLQQLIKPQHARELNTPKNFDVVHPMEERTIYTGAIFIQNKIDSHISGIGRVAVNKETQSIEIGADGCKKVSNRARPVSKVFGYKISAAKSWLMLALLSACGGVRNDGEGSTDLETGELGGRVFDGYISGARVFRDIDGDFSLGSGEVSVLTNDAGLFYNLTGPSSATLVADSNGKRPRISKPGFPTLRS